MEEHTLVSNVSALGNLETISKDPRLGKYVRNIYPLTGRIGSKRSKKETLGEGAFGRVNLEEFAEGEVATKYFTSEDTMCANINEIAMLKYLQGLPYVAQLIRVEYKPAQMIKGDLLPASKLENIPFPAAIMGRAKTTLSDRSIYGSWDDVFSVVKQVLKGYYVLHSNYIAHRDTKPKNMLMTSVGEVWITDFGMSQYLPPDVIPPSDVYTGTSHYAAPELLLDRAIRLGETHDYFKADCWAVGVSLYEIITGKRLFRIAEKSVNDILEHMFHIKGDPDEFEDGKTGQLFQMWSIVRGYYEITPLKPKAISELLEKNAVYKPVDMTIFHKVANVVEGLLTYDPKKRLPIRLALEMLVNDAIPRLPPPRVITKQYMTPRPLPSDITPNTLDILFDWLHEVSYSSHFDFSVNSLAFVLDRAAVYTMSFLYTYRDSPFVNRKNLQLIGITALYFAGCFFDSTGNNPLGDIKELIYITAKTYTKEQIMECIKLFLSGSIQFFGLTFLDQILLEIPRLDTNIIQTYGFLNYACFQKNIFNRDPLHLVKLKYILQEYVTTKGKLDRKEYFDDKIRVGVEGKVIPKLKAFITDVIRRLDRENPPLVRMGAMHNLMKGKGGRLKGMKTRRVRNAKRNTSRNFRNGFGR